MYKLIKKSIEKSKSLILIAVASSLIASATAFVYGMIKTFTVILNFVISYGKDPLGVIALLGLMDIFGSVLNSMTYLKKQLKWKLIDTEKSFKKGTPCLSVSAVHLHAPSWLFNGYIKVT